MKQLLTFLIFLSYPLVGIDIDLKEPTLSDGVLSTEQGGVISAPNFRVQARQVEYTMKDNQSLLEAKQDIILEFGDYIFVSHRLIYNFQTKTGILYNGRTSADPWFIGGEEIHLCADGSYMIHNGFATTSENYKMDWKIETERAHLRHHKYLSAHNVKFRWISLPLFWVPNLELNLDTLFDSPLRYTFKLGGTRGAKIGAIYTLYSTDQWKTNMRLDYRFKSGFGGGFDAHYKSTCGYSSFNTINYISRDRTRAEGDKMTRYRLEGNYHTLLNKAKTSVNLMWDKLSDQEMATDYDDKDLRLEIAKPTQLEIRHKEQNWILSLLTRIRANGFQTVKQELPTLSGSYRPFEVGHTGIIANGQFKASYLELEYTDNSPLNHDYNSPRYEISQSFWRPYRLGWIYLTPECGGVAIYYGNNPKKHERWMLIGQLDTSMHTDLYRYYGDYKHVLTPYLKYQYYTYPTTSPVTPQANNSGTTPNGHYVFDIDDGWYRLNTLRFGMTNNIYSKTVDCCIYRKLYVDIFAYSFFKTKTMPTPIPKGYIKCVYNATHCLRNTINMAWDFKHNMLDHFNLLIELTFNQNTAVSAEYRHRSRFDWRKVDHLNFILDSFKNSNELKNSTLSDQRDTILFHFYWRFHPSWSLGLQSRNGWNRELEPNYNEYQISLFGTFRSSWHIKMAYKHRERDDRFSISFSLGLKKPCYDSGSYTIPCLEF